MQEEKKRKKLKSNCSALIGALWDAPGESPWGLTDNPRALTPTTFANSILWS